MKNPLLLLIAIMLLGFVSLLSLNLQLAPTNSDKQLGVTLLCIASWLLLTFLCARTARILQKEILEPQLEAKAKLLAQLKEKSEDMNLEEVSKNIVQELELARQRERLIADYSSDLLLCLNEEIKIIEANLRAESLLGYSVASLLGTPARSIIAEEDSTTFLNFFKTVKEGDNKKTLEVRAKSAHAKLIDLEIQSEWSNNLSCYFCLCKDISERKQNQRLKAEVAAMVTHDLRAPITGISYFMESLSKGLYGELPEKMQAEITKAKLGTENILAMINQLLEAEKLEGGDQQASFEYIPLTDLYEQCNTMLSNFAALKQIRVVFPESSTIVLADFGHLSHIFSNLISNAIKFSPSNSAVVVTENVLAETVTITITDEGPGVPDARKKSIFERFKSEDVGSNHVITGTGLGLYICRQLIELQGGKIWVEDATTGGAAFSFNLKRVKNEDLQTD